MGVELKYEKVEDGYDEVTHTCGHLAGWNFGKTNEFERI